MPIEVGDRVWLDYIVVLPDGAVLDTSVREVAEEAGLVESGIAAGESFEPIEVVVGEAEPPWDALADGLVGMEPGDVDTAHAELAEDHIAEYDPDEFRAMLGTEPEPGLHVEASDGATGTVTDIEDGSVLVDFSHGLAGKAVEVKLKVIRVEPG